MAYYQVGRSEDEVGEKVDRCASDSIIKIGEFSSNISDHCPCSYSCRYVDLNVSSKDVEGIGLDL